MYKKKECVEDENNSYAYLNEKKSHLVDYFTEILDVAFISCGYVALEAKMRGMQQTHTKTHNFHIKLLI